MDLKLPQHSSHRQALVVIIACVIVVSFAYILSVVLGPRQITPPQQEASQALQLNDQMTVLEKKEALLARSSQANQASTTPLTSSEKSAIFNELGGSKAQKYNLTPAEKAVILNALNAK